MESEKELLKQEIDKKERTLHEKEVERLKLESENLKKTN